MFMFMSKKSLLEKKNFWIRHKEKEENVSKQRRFISKGELYNRIEKKKNLSNDFFFIIKFRLSSYCSLQKNENFFSNMEITRANLVDLAAAYPSPFYMIIRRFNVILPLNLEQIEKQGKIFFACMCLPIICLCLKCYNCCVILFRA